MQTISIILVAALFLLTDPPAVSGRIPRDGVDPRTQEQEEEDSKSSEARTITFAHHQEENESEQSPSSRDTEELEYEKISAPPCNDPFGCKKEIQESELDQEEYRRLRIEVIKGTILQKLGLKSPPQVKLNRSVLPSVLLSHSQALLEELNEEPEESHSRSANLREEDNFYGTTKNVFVFPENSSSQIRCSEPTSLCLVFRLTPEDYSGNVVSSHLWLYKPYIPAPFDGVPVSVNQTLVISDLAYDSQFKLIRKRVLSQEDDEGAFSSGEWLRLRVDKAVQRWIRKPHIVHALEISCKGCGNHSVPVSQAKDQRPFIEVSLNVRPSLSRKRRSVDCTNTTSRCCKESFYLNFTDIGWNDYIIAPAGFTASYCRGTCNSFDRHKSQGMELYLKSLSSCCAPSKKKGLLVLYFSEDTVQIRRLRDITVDACDCT